ncbi:hypothetical protein RCL_jg19799.t1 [Rhizophagus clarus]|uniref:Uncharacterized protein n=1 Tax=Rhizophagus clarus TaxID=94130 RepID=A0A8H3R5R4_9GLOM|nr:hypothetical protein RCL_jg19799.t1 [Rhizophagus clarus]
MSDLYLENGYTSQFDVEKYISKENVKNKCPRNWILFLQVNFNDDSSVPVDLKILSHGSVRFDLTFRLMGSSRWGRWGRWAKSMGPMEVDGTDINDSIGLA